MFSFLLKVNVLLLDCIVEPVYLSCFVHEFTFSLVMFCICTPVVFLIVGDWQRQKHENYVINFASFADVFLFSYVMFYCFYEALNLAAPE